MARATFVKKARKDIPSAGIKKGDSYYWWKFRFGSKHYSKTAPRASQLTQSDFLSRVYSIDERIMDMDLTSDFETEVQEIISELSDMQSECEDKLSNMPDQLQDAPSGQTLQNRVDSLQEMIDVLENLELELEEPDDEDVKNELGDKDDDETDEEYQERLSDKKDEMMDEQRENLLSEIQQAQYSGE